MGIGNLKEIDNIRDHGSTNNISVNMFYYIISVNEKQYISQKLSNILKIFIKCKKYDIY